MKRPAWLSAERLALYGLGFAVVILGFGLGYLAREFHWFPYPTFRVAQDFVAGGVGDRDTSVWQKLQNDLQRVPYRHSQLLDERLDIGGFDELRLPDEGPFRAAHSRLIYRRAANARGAYLVHGVFDLSDGLHGTLLVGADGSLIRSWPAQVDASAQRDAWLRNSQGLAFDPAGDLISIAAPHLRATGFCGQQRFVRRGPFHHVVSLNDDQSFWTLKNGTPVRHSALTGERLSRLDVLGLMHANPDYFGLELHALDWQLDELPRRNPGGLLPEYFRPKPLHINDVEALPETLAGQFPGFAAGDLLISFRSLSLILVVRPDSGEVLWQAQGVSSGQHDPDWNADGTISFFDNRERRPYSDIRSLRPARGESAGLNTALVLAGARYQMHSRRWGSHQRLGDGSTIVVAPQQGRLLHVDAGGEVRFELLSLLQRPGEALRTLRFYEAIYLDDSQLSHYEQGCRAGL